MTQLRLLFIYLDFVIGDLYFPEYSNHRDLSKNSRSIFFILLDVIMTLCNLLEQAIVINLLIQWLRKGQIKQDISIYCK